MSVTRASEQLDKTPFAMNPSLALPREVWSRKSRRRAHLCVARRGRGLGTCTYVVGVCGLKKHAQAGAFGESKAEDRCDGESGLGMTDRPSRLLVTFVRGARRGIPVPTALLAAPAVHGALLPREAQALRE